MKGGLNEIWIVSILGLCNSLSFGSVVTVLGGKREL
jgi:hypothetical protein